MDTTGEELFPLTNPQKSFWYMEKMYPNTSFGNISASIRLRNMNDYKILERAINICISNNEAMRTRIIESFGEPKQYFLPYEYKKIDYFDYSNSEDLNEWIGVQTKKPFDLVESELFYFAIIKINGNEIECYLKMHHIICDAWTFINIAKEILKACGSLKFGNNNIFNNKPSYKEYILKEIEFMNSESIKTDKMFWSDKFKTVPELMCFKQVNSGSTDLKTSRKNFHISNKVSSMITNYCKDTRNSVLSLFMAAFYIYLYRVTSINDIVIGTPIYNRTNYKEKMMAGMFINMLPLRANIDGDLDFISTNFLVTKELMKCLKHQKYSYELILSDFRRTHKLVPVLFDTVISYQNAKIDFDKDIIDFETQWHFNYCQLEALAIHINDRNNTGDLYLEFDYLEALYSESEIIRLYNNLLTLIKDAISNPLKKISNIEILSELERNQVLYDFNNVKSEYSLDKCLHQLFEEQVERTPNNIAVSFKDESITYRELNQKANNLANLLRKKGALPDMLIGIMLERSIELIVSIFAVLKSGAAYLPIDTEYPKERIKYIIEDGKVQLLLSERHLIDNIGYIGEFIDVCSKNMDNTTNCNIENINSTRDLVYTIYTSGSTGRSKGVLVEHRNVIAYINSFIKEFDLVQKDVVLQQASCCFDAFVEEVYPIFLRGGKLVIVNKEDILDINKFVSIINQNAINLISCSPFILNNLNKMPKLKSVHTFISGGDVLKLGYISNLVKYAKVYNTYGPTEATVCSSYFKCSNEIKESIPIGKPIANYKIYILDQNNKPLPIAIPGELCIAGIGVARGYLNRPELTAEKFVENPFVNGEKMYRTGDLARWLPDGNIEFLGRIDNQVKIRGFRIELGEIETQMLKIEGIKESIVVAKTNTHDNKYLSAYYTANREITVKELRQELSKELPDYMLPVCFIKLEEFPITSNGKVNRSVLPEPEFQMNQGVDYVAPYTNTEVRLVKLWEKVLELKHIGVNEDFFEIGGDSLKASILMVEIYKEFNLDILLVKIFSESTIKKFGAYIDSLKNQEYIFDCEKIVKLKESQFSRENIFLIHDGSCTVEGYMEFSQLLEVEMNIWGIKSSLTKETDSNELSIEAIAKDYVETIKKVQKQGPYFIAGWSTGGIITFEIALQLELIDEVLGFVCLIDSVPPKKYGREPLYKKYIQDIDNLNHDILGIIPNEALNLISNYKNLKEEYLKDRIYAIKVLEEVKCKYTPSKKLKSEIIYIKASQSNISDMREWDSYCQKPIKYFEVQGNHFSIFKNPDVIGLVHTFKQALL